VFKEIQQHFQPTLPLRFLFYFERSQDLINSDTVTPASFLYKVVEVLVAFVPSIAVLAVALSLNVDLFYFVTSLSILVLLLQLVSVVELISLLHAYSV
jgi:hypothetical protein